jgi:hypothetical protein
MAAWIRLTDMKAKEESGALLSRSPALSANRPLDVENQ